MNQTEIADALFAIHFAADRSKRYHAHRLADHRFLITLIQIINCAVASVAFVGVLEGWPLVKSSVSILAAILSAIAAYQCLSKKIESHADKKARFGDLKTMLPVDLEKGTEEMLAKIIAAREAIEKDDSHGFPCLDILTHNEECFARGQEADVKSLNWWQRWIGCHILPIPYN